MGRIAACFARRETRLTCRDMVNGFLMELEDYNCWTIEEAAGHPGPHRMQHLLSRACVDDSKVLDATAAWVAGHLAGERDPVITVLIVDETADAKSSADCAGASRQYSGTIGDIAMCQVQVTLTFAGPAGHALAGRALYLPEDWAAREERRRSWPGSRTRSCSPRNRNSPGDCCSMPMTWASARDSSPATKYTAAWACARASGNAAPATCWPYAPITR